MASVVGRNAGNRFSLVSTDLQEAVPSEPETARHFLARQTRRGPYFLRAMGSSLRGGLRLEGGCRVVLFLSLKLFNLIIFRK